MLPIRIRKEIAELREEPLEGITVRPQTDDSLYLYHVTIQGPVSTPYEGYSLCLDFEYSSGYPFRAPSVRFTTPVYHPNISTSGRISLNILAVDWSPTCSIQSALLGVQWLLSNPNPIDVENPEAGRLYLTDQRAYVAQVRELLQRG